MNDVFEKKVMMWNVLKRLIKGNSLKKRGENEFSQSVIDYNVCVLKKKSY